METRALVGISHQLCHVKTADKVASRAAVQILVTSDSFDIRMRGYVQATDVAEIVTLGLRDIRRGDRRAFTYLLAVGYRESLIK